MSSLRKLLAVNAIVGLTLIVSFGNNVAIAAFFGLGRDLDAYFAALTIPGLMVALFIDYLGRNFLPVYSEVAADPGAADALVSNVVTTVGLLTTIMALALWFVGDRLFTLMLPGFDPNAVQLVTRMFALLAPTIVLIAVSTFHEYIWQHDRRYKGVVACKMLLPISILLFLLLGHDRLGIWALPAGYLSGHLAIFLVLWIGAGYRYRPRITWDARLRRIFVNSGILMGSGLITRIRPIIERYFASDLADGGIAALSLGNRLTKPIHRSAMVGVRMMAFSRSARLQAQGEREKVGELTQRAVTLVLLVVVPLVVWIIFSREELVRVLFERGRFDAEMSEKVALVLIGMVPTVAFRCCNQLMSQAFYVLDKIKGIAILSPVSTGFFLISIMLLAEPLGILGIALAGSFGFVFTFFVMLIMLGRQFERFSALAVTLGLATYTFASVASLWLARWLLAYLGAGKLLMIIVPALLAIPLYLLMLVVLRNAAVKDLWNLVRESRHKQDDQTTPA